MGRWGAQDQSASSSPHKAAPGSIEPRGGFGASRKVYLIGRKGIREAPVCLPNSRVQPKLGAQKKGGRKMNAHKSKVEKEQTEFKEQERSPGKWNNGT